LEVKIFEVESSFNLWIGRIEKLKSSINLESINVIGDDSPANVSTTLKNDNVYTCIAQDIGASEPGETCSNNDDGTLRHVSNLEL
jgi:hypothetical protein